MLDATAKIPSGLLRGNVNQYGDFDECLEVPNAKYCLADIDLEPIWNKPLSNFKKSHSFTLSFSRRFWRCIFKKITNKHKALI